MRPGGGLGAACGRPAGEPGFPVVAADAGLSVTSAAICRNDWFSGLGREKWACCIPLARVTIR